MAKANDKSSTIDWIWLHDALMLAAPRFGSAVLAKIRLKEWLAAGKLPWSCMQWDGLDAEGIARLDREQRELIDDPKNRVKVFHILPSVAYREGDPQFWCADVKIFWEENGAREQATGGARALGIKVSRKHLRALLPDESREESRQDEKKAGSQQRRVLPVLTKLYPPNGKVPDDVSTEVVKGQVAGELSADSKNRGLADPSWDTVNRVLGREKK